LWACGMVLKRPEKKVNLTFARVSLCRLWVNVHVMPYLVILYGSLLVFTFLFCLCFCPAGLVRGGDHWRNPHIRWVKMCLAVGRRQKLDEKDRKAHFRDIVVK
jgi:hypothetical protein